MSRVCDYLWLIAMELLCESRLPEGSDWDGWSVQVKGTGGQL